MSTTFSEYQTRSILQTVLIRTPSHVDRVATTTRERRLQSLVSQLNAPLQKDALIASISACIREVGEHECQNAEEEALEWATLGRSVLGVYTEVMRILLMQAREAEEEADWWRRVGQVGGGTAWYLLQTFPQRLGRLGKEVIYTIKEHSNQPITLQAFSVQNLDRIFPQNAFPHLFKRAFFPHTRIPFDVFRTNPIELTRRECRAHRLDLEKLRDKRAESLGRLASIRRVVEDALTEKGSVEEKKDNILTVLQLLEASLHDDLLDSPNLDLSVPPPSPLQVQQMSISKTTRAILPRLQTILGSTLNTHANMHSTMMSPLRRPSRLTRLWPRFVFLPPLAWVVFRTIFNSRAQLYATMIDARETVVGFWYSWVIEPIQGILQTVRTGGDESTRVVSKEGLNSDLDSLERMVLSLAKEKLNYSQEQLETLSYQVRQGDLTPVLKIYEQDIKSPLSSIFTGNLVRSLLIQVHKTKVDVDLALSGIDKLIHSQELTFAFVGVAPSLAVLRVERLLNIPPSSNSDPDKGANSPLTQGLIILSVNHMRNYAVNHLPPRSQLQQGFLDDIEDLEDASGQLTREDKLRVVDRMWRSWGSILGWDGDAIRCMAQ
ncbi:Nuclear control of ATPase protein 2 [Tulasnella sp. 403]|nr:Nuclear control of ATPase protein 2 [Tulasnella sp. 403]